MGQAKNIINNSNRKSKNNRTTKLFFQLGEPLSHEELIRRDERRRERKILRQLEKQRRRLESRGIVKDLATLRAEWQQKRINLTLGGASNGEGPSSERSVDEEDLDEDDDDDDDDEIDVENDDREEDRVMVGQSQVRGDGLAPHVADDDDVSNVQKDAKVVLSSSSSFSIDNLLSHAMKKKKMT